MHVGTFTREGTWAAAAARAAASWRTSASRCIEVMPVAEFPGASAGATTASTCSRRPASTARPTTSAASSTRPTRSASASSSTSSTTTSGPDGNYLRLLRARLLHRPLRDRVGRGAQLRRRRTPGRCASSSSPTPPTGSTSSTSTGCGSTPRRRSSTTRREHILAEHHARRVATRRGGAVDRRRRRERAAARDAAASAPSSGGYGLDALWNDDFHHRATVAADRAQRGLLHRLPRHARRSSSRRPSTATCSRASATPGRASAAARPALDLPPRRVRQLPRRTTTRSPTRHAACGCTS